MMVHGIGLLAFAALGGVIGAVFVARRRQLRAPPSCWRRSASSARASGQGFWHAWPVPVRPRSGLRGKTRRAR
jgi:hypothetical protein